MDNMRELFEHELRDIYDGERRFLDALGTFSEHVHDPSLKEAFELHRDQTKGQIERLEEVFEELGEDPQRQTCHGVKGLVEEHDAFMKEEPAPEVGDVFHVWSGMKAERYEITAYESLIATAETLGLEEAAELLRENLEEEQEALGKLKAFAVEDGASRKLLRESGAST